MTMRMCSLRILVSLLALLYRVAAMPQVESAPEWEERGIVSQSTSTVNQGMPSNVRDVLKWIWIEGAALGVEWSSKFSLALNGAVTAYNLTLTRPGEGDPFTSVTMYHAAALRHQFEDLGTNITYNGRLVALVGQHYWPYSLLNFTFTSPVLKRGHGLGKEEARAKSEISDLEDVNVAVTLRWTPEPFVMGGSPSPSGVVRKSSSPVGYRINVWDHKQIVQEMTTSVSDKDKGTRVTLKNLALDTQYKVTLEGLHTSGRVGVTLSFSLDAGGLFVAGGERTTDGVSECYSNLQVRCPGSERCVSPYWICDGSPDCPDSADEIGCDRSPCNGFRCWDDLCIPASWRCDGHEDCRDGEDEYECPECSTGAVTCPSGGGCVSVNVTCDGVEDCPDGWDESGEVCSKRGCGVNEFSCGDGQCVLLDSLCDGVADCRSSRDEEINFCHDFLGLMVVATTPQAVVHTTPQAVVQTTPQAVVHTTPQAVVQTTPQAVVQMITAPCSETIERVNCTHEEFRCASEECVLRAALCDGKRDCESGDDEEFPVCNLIFKASSAKGEAKSDASQCDESAMTRCPSGKCVPHGEECNKENDCIESGDSGGETCVNATELANATSSVEDEIGENEINNDIENNLTMDIPPTTFVLPVNVVNETGASIHGLEHSILNTSATNNESVGGIIDSSVERDEKAMEGETEENAIASQTLTSIEDEDRSDDVVEIVVDVSVEGSTYPEGLENDFDVTTTGDFEELDVESSGDDELPEVIVTVSPPSVTPSVLEATTIRLNVSFNEEDMRDNEITSNETDMDGGFPEEKSESSFSYSSSMESDESSESATTSFEIGGIGSNMTIENTSFISSKSSLSSSESEELDNFRGLANHTDKNVSLSEERDTTYTEAKSEFNDSSEERQSWNITTPDTTTTMFNTSTNPTFTPTSEVTKGTERNTTLEEEDVGSGEAETISEFDSLNITLASSTARSLTTEATLVSDSDATTSSHDLLSTTTNEISTSTSETTTPKLTSEVSHPSTTSQITSTITTFSTETTSWKDLPADQQNLTVLIAIHSEINQTRIPEYVIHGLDGNTYEYEVVSVVKDEELARKVQLTATRRPPVRKPSKVEGETEFEGEVKVSNGTHEILYLQDKNISSASSISPSLLPSLMVLLLRAVLPAG